MANPTWPADLEKIGSAKSSNQGCLSFPPSKLGIKLKNHELIKHEKGFNEFIPLAWALCQ